MSFSFSAPAFVHGARISGLEARMDQVEDRICDLDARGSEEADNLANDRDLDRFILTGKFMLLNLLQDLGGQSNYDLIWINCYHKTYLSGHGVSLVVMRDNYPAMRLCCIYAFNECLEGSFYCFRATQTSFGRAKGSIWNGVGFRSKISSWFRRNRHHLGQVNEII